MADTDVRNEVRWWFAAGECDRCGHVEEIQPLRSSRGAALVELQRLGWETDGDMQICGRCATEVAAQDVAELRKERDALKARVWTGAPVVAGLIYRANRGGGSGSDG